MERSGRIVRVSLVGIAVNVLLVVFKAMVGAVTGSIAIIMDAVNNLSDALSSVITIVGTKIAGRKPDRKHPYGYGRVEYVTSVTIAAIVLLTGVASFSESFQHILSPEAATYSATSIIIIAVAVAVKYALGRYVRAQGKELNSESLVASGTDAVFDSVISLSTLVAAAVSIVFHINIEGWLGAIISVVIVKTGIEILMESMGGIIGRRVDGGLVEDIRSVVLAHAGVIGAYDLVLHQYGPEQYIGSVHIEVDDGMTAGGIHGLTRSISEDVYRRYGIVMTVGIYASNTGNEEYAGMREDLERIVSEYPEVLQMHGFYVDGAARVVTFDLVVDFGVEDPDGLRSEIVERIGSEHPGYAFYAVLDRDYRCGNGMTGSAIG